MFIVMVGFDLLCDEGVVYVLCVVCVGSEVEYYYLFRYYYGIVIVVCNIVIVRYLLECVVFFVWWFVEKDGVNI